MIEGCMFKPSHGATIADDPSAVFDYVADASRQRSVVIAAAMASNVVTSITPKIATHVIPRLAPSRHGSVAAVAMSPEVCACRPDVAVGLPIAPSARRDTRARSAADRAWNLDQEGRLGSSPASTLT